MTGARVYIVEWRDRGKRGWTRGWTWFSLRRGAAVEMAEKRRENRHREYRIAKYVRE